MSFRIAPRFFNRFILLSALFCLALIAIFTLRQPRKAREAFDATLRLELNTPWVDSLSVLHSDGEFACGPESVFLFWAPWSERSLQVIDSLAAFQAGRVDGPCYNLLGVKEDPARMRSLAMDSPLQARWFDATSVYGTWNVPGVPTLFTTIRSGDTLSLRSLHVGIDPQDAARPLR